LAGAAWYAATFSASAARWVRLPLSPATRMPMASRPWLFASDFAARPGEIIGAAGGWRERLALDQRPRGERIDRGRARAGAAE